MVVFEKQSKSDFSRERVVWHKLWVVSFVYLDLKANLMLQEWGSWLLYSSEFTRAVEWCQYSWDFKIILHMFQNIWGWQLNGKITPIITGSASHGTCSQNGNKETVSTVKRYTSSTIKHAFLSFAIFKKRLPEATPVLFMPFSWWLQLRIIYKFFDTNWSLKDIFKVLKGWQYFPTLIFFYTCSKIALHLLPPAESILSWQLLVFTFLYFS